MGAAVVSVSHGAIGSLLGKLGDLLTGEYKLLKEAKGEIMFLKAELESMRKFLERMSDAEEEADKQAKCWAEEVRDLSYDIEDNVDDFMLRVECESSSKPHGFKGFIERSINLLTTINTRHKIGKELQGLKSRVMEVSERRMRYKVEDTVSKPNNTAIDIRLQALYAETAGLEGINEPRDELIKVMLEEDGVCAQQLKVLSVVGFGGLGKTTLANEIYRKLEGQFQCRAFVSVSQKPNIRKIFRNILSQSGYVAPNQTNTETWDEDQLISTLRRFLADKRYSIVIDDIWDPTTWSIVRCALPENRKGSIVITTTRIETVATACCSNRHDYVYKMKLLSNEDSRKLFFKRVFGSEDGCPRYLEEVSAEILKRCGGLPLAIISISSLLASQPKMLKGQWEDILRSLGSNLEVHPTLDGMRKILNLSYTNLPHYLKTCMLYLGIYPEDHIINKNDLVRQWLAQGFISISHVRDPEAVAEGYFNELVNRSIIQPVDTNHNDEVLSCKVHDMMLDLIIHKCREDNFITAVEDLQAVIGLQGNVRRLSLYLDDVIDGATLGTARLSQVRALARFGISTYTPPLSEFKHLRVLTLEFPDKLMKLDLRGMCHLFQLRYLKIVAYDCEKIVLPRKIRRLEQLETFELRARKSSTLQVPSDIVSLHRLLHLVLPIGISLPSGIGSMKSLCTLQGFDLAMNSVDNIKDLGKLTNLKGLEISLFYWEDLDEMEARKLMNILISSLGKLCNLKYLYMESYLPRVCSDALSSLSTSPRLLRRLQLRGCMLSRVPKWIQELHNLYDLALGVKEVLDDDVGIIAQLHSLIHLDLYIFGTPKERVTICGTGFLALKHFEVTCRWTPYLTFAAGAMPKLQRLEVGFNAREWEQYGAAFVGIEHLSSLKEVSVCIGGYGAEESSARAAQSVLRDAIGMHPSCPTANIKWDESMRFSFDD